jgi:hypothetical protein
MIRQTISNDCAQPKVGIYRWGMMVVILFLIGWSIQIELKSVEFSWKQLGHGFVVPVILLLNHLAFEFRWPKLAGIAITTLAFTWLFVAGYVVYVDWLSL